MSSTLPTHTVAYGVFCQSVGIDRDKAIKVFYTHIHRKLLQIV